MRGQGEKAAMLLDKSSDIHPMDKESWSGSVAASYGERGAKFLTDRGNDMNANEGSTALIQASRSGHYETTHILLKKGADVNVKDGDGRTALAHAKAAKRSAVADLLQKYGAKE
jgi:ankyrin repeat protein